MMSVTKSKFWNIRKGAVVAGLAVLAALAVSSGAPATQAASTAHPVNVAFLGVEFLNDNEMYEPTSAAEWARVKNVEDIFTAKLAKAGEFNFIPVSNEVRTKIAKGQSLGACGGCEIEYGKQLKAERIAWIRVQKVSNLILNMNVYMADVATSKMTFVRSVDIRGNTDDSWSIGMNWLIKHYMMPSTS